eukprot:7329999-Pyramimonas_sp.AAC.1
MLSGSPSASPPSPFRGSWLAFVKKAPKVLRCPCSSLAIKAFTPLAANVLAMLWVAMREAWS